MYCPDGNATGPIWRVLASSQGISSWTHLKPQHSNPNPNPLANQFWSIDFLTPPTPLIIPHRLPAFLESLMPLKNWCSIHASWSKRSLKHCICFCGMFYEIKTEFYCIRRILQSVRAKTLQATLLFVDFTKAFDCIHRGKMEQILLAYVLPKETVAAITILYRNAKVKVRSPDGNTEYFDIVAGVQQGDMLAPYLFIICLDYVLRTSIDKIRENGFELTKKRSRRYPGKTITDADYADDIALLANTLNQAETLLHSLERAAAGIGLHVNAHKTEYMCYNQIGDISTLDRTSLKLVDKFTYLGSSVSSTEKDIDTWLTKAWTAIDRLSIIWKSDLTDKRKRTFFQAAVVSILLYGCTTWTQTKRLKKLDGNYTRMLRAILNKSWRQHPKRHQLYGHLPPITKTIEVRRTRHAGHYWRSKDELISDVIQWTPKYGRAKVGRPARTYIQQLCEDTGCSPKDLPEVMNDREKWREWWWWSFFYSVLTSRLHFWNSPAVKIGL